MGVGENMSFLDYKGKYGYGSWEYLENYWNNINSYDSYWKVNDTDHSYIDEDGCYVLEIECPGFNKDNVHVDIIGDSLEIVGENKFKKHKNTFKRTYTIDNNYSEIKAKVEDGILSLTFKKKEKDVKKIKVL
jgi:HSP20 family molecular chaperone IbpA